MLVHVWVHSICVLVSVCGVCIVSHHTCGRQRTVIRSWLSLFAMWVVEIKLILSRLSLSHLTTSLSLHFL